MSRNAIAGACVLALAGLAGVVHAEVIESGLSGVLAIGPPRGRSPMMHVDARRTTCSPVRLPSRPSIAWSARAPGPLSLPPAIDAKGHLIGVTDRGDLFEIDDSGKLVASERFGAPPIAGPAITTNGTRWIVTATGELIGTHPTGRVTARAFVSRNETIREAQLLPERDGVLTISVGSRVTRFNAAAHRIGSFDAGAPVHTLLGFERRVIAVTRPGAVVRWNTDGTAETIANLGAPPITPTPLTADGTLLGVVAPNRVVKLDRGRPRATTMFETSELVASAPALAESGSLYLVTRKGHLVKIPARGAPTSWELGAPAGSRVASPPAGSAVLLVAPDESVAFALAGRPAGVLSSADGTIDTATNASCGNPIALLPGAPGRLVLVCGSGRILGLGESDANISN